MDVPAAGKHESGGKYEEVGNNRHRHRRGRRRRAELTEVGRFTRRKRGRKKKKERSEYKRGDADSAIVAVRTSEKEGK